MRAFGSPPSLGDIEAVARATLSRLPEPFAASAAEVLLSVEEFANEEMLAEMGMDDPYELTGLYVGHPLTERSADDVARMPDRVFLFRSPILLEWCETGESLEHLVAHVLIHELGHHFGLSDEDMHALEEAAAP